MKKLRIFGIILLCLVLFGCNMPDHAISVTFGDLTASGGTDHVVAIRFQEEKDYEKLGADILFKSDKDVKINIQPELKEKQTFDIEKDKYYSITALFYSKKDKTAKYVVYKEARSINLIVTCDEEVTLTFKAIVGTLGEGDTLLTNKLDVSQEFVQKIKKHEK